MVAIRVGEQLVMEPGEFRGGAAFLRCYVGLVLLFVADQPVFEGRLFRIRGVAAQGPVGFMNAAVAEKGGEPLQRL